MTLECIFCLGSYRRLVSYRHCNAKMLTLKFGNIFVTSEARTQYVQKYVQAIVLK